MRDDAFSALCIVSDFLPNLLAGMPAALPENLPIVLRLNEEPHQRLQAISFFLLGILLASAAVMGLWNFLSRDFKFLPRLSFLKAVSVVVQLGAVIYSGSDDDFRGAGINDSRSLAADRDYLSAQKPA